MRSAHALLAVALSGAALGCDDATEPDPTAVDATRPDAVDAGAPADAGIDPAPRYIEHCESLYAVRIVELQIELDAAFPLDCEAPLRDDVGALSDAGGAPQCRAGESANACQRRNYETPPPLTAFGRGCAPSERGCFVAKWVPKCMNGTDAGCAEPEAICVDGTRPAVHIEPATAGASSRWIIHMGGEGGPCEGARCWLDYRFVGNTEFTKAMSSHHPDHPLRATQVQGGILNGRAGGMNPFAAFNRVRMKRCGDAASDAVEVVEVADGVDPAIVEAFPDVFAETPIRTRVSEARAYYRGHATYLALFRGLTTNAGRDLDGDGAPDLPDLTDATQVVLAASSDASIWLVFAADALAEELRSIAGPGLDVRVMLDGHFDVALDTQGRLHPDAPEDFDALRHTFYSTGLCALPDNADGIDNEACSDLQYAEGGPLRAGYDARNIVRDASCEAFHGAGHPACSDKLHTLVHHVSAKALVLADQEDRTISGVPPTFAEDRTYLWALPDYRAGVLDFGLDIQASWSTGAREEGPGADGDFALILHKFYRSGGSPSAATHVRFGATDKLADGMTLCASDGTPIASPSFSTLIGAWLADMSPSPFAIEAGPRWDGTSNYWVTGPGCVAPE